MGTLLVVFFLLVVCGLIAYTGDLLGRRMGKRRLTAFGLRPKHTAILFTITTGVLIAGLSLGAAFGLSPGVRLALTQGEALVLKNAALRSGIRTLNRDFSRLSGTLGQKQAEIGTLQTRESRLRQQNRQLETETATLNRQFGSLSQSVRRLTATNRGLAGQQRRLQTDVQQLQVKNTGLQGENERLAARTRRDRAELRRVAQQNLDLSTKNANLAGLQRALTDNLTSAQRQITVAQGDLQILRDAVGTLRRTAQRLATEEFIYSEGEEIARRIVPPNPPEEVIRTQLETLLYEVRHLAERRKARPDKEHPEPAYLAPISVRGKDGREQVLDQESAVIRHLARSLALGPESTVLRAVAVENSIANGPVAVSIQVFRNRIVLRKGEEIASQRIYGRESEGAVLEELVAFLQSEVRMRALRSLGMIPGPLGEVGEVRFDPLLEVARKIRQTGGWARIGAVARQDTWSAGPLHLEFYVVPETANDAGR